MRNLIKILMVGLCAICLMGMSGFGATSEPQPSNYRAEITDTGERSLSVSSATIDGHTVLKGKLGKGRIQVPFETIERIDFDKNRATIQIRGNAQRLTVEVNGFSQLTGRTAFGTYQIALKDLKRLHLVKDSQ